MSRDATRSAPSRPAIRAAMVVAALLCAAGPTRAETPLEELEAALTQRFEELTPDDKELAAQRWGLLRTRSAAPLLERCARTLDGASAACLVGLVAVGGPRRVSAFRHAVRLGKDSVTVAIGAATLAAWRDRFSGDLLLLTLLDRRDALSAGALADAYLSLKRLHASRYLYWMWQAIPDSAARVAVGQRVLERSVGRRKQRVRTELARLAEDPGVTPRVEQRREVVHSQSLWVERLTALASAVQVSLDEAQLARHARQLVSAAKRRRLTKVVWASPEAVRRLSPAGQRVRQQSKAQLEARWRDPELPADFDTFELGLEQPSWWPRGMRLSIDDGPRPHYLRRILPVLDSFGVKAIFFWVGSSILRRWLETPEETRALLTGVLDAGHTMGFHGMNHVLEPAEHLMAWEPEQLADSVALYRRLVTYVFGREVPIIYGRMPGGMGAKRSYVRAGFHLAELHASVPYNVGANRWYDTATLDEVRGFAHQACRRVRQGRWVGAVTHEAGRAPRQISVFLQLLKRTCPRASEAASVQDEGTAP